MSHKNIRIHMVQRMNDQLVGHGCNCGDRSYDASDSSCSGALCLEYTRNSQDMEVGGTISTKTIGADPMIIKNKLRIL